MIKKYNEFLIKESSEIEEYDDIRDIFSDMIDNYFKLEVIKSFFTEFGMKSDTLDTEYKIPGIFIKLNKSEKGKLTENSTINIISTLGEAVDRLSNFGEAIIKNMDIKYIPSGNEVSSYTQFKFEIYVLQKEKQVEISDKEGFYDFMSSLRRNFNKYSNKVTNSFNIEQGKDEAILVPKEGVDSKQMLSSTKSQLKKFFDPWYISWRNRTPYEYTYDVKLVDNNIHLAYKQKFRLDRHNRRIEE